MYMEELFIDWVISHNYVAKKLGNYYLGSLLTNHSVICKCPTSNIDNMYAMVYVYMYVCTIYVTRPGRTGLIYTFCISRNIYLKYSMDCPSLVLHYNHTRRIILIV